MRRVSSFPRRCRVHSFALRCRLHPAWSTIRDFEAGKPRNICCCSCDPYQNVHLSHCVLQLLSKPDILCDLAGPFLVRDLSEKQNHAGILQL